MFISVSADGQLLYTQFFGGEAPYSISVVKAENAYFLFSNDGEIGTVFPVVCSETKIFLTPNISISPKGARIIFVNANSVTRPTGFSAMVFMKDRGNDEIIPNIDDVFQQYKCLMNSANPSSGEPLGGVAGKF